MKHALPVRGVGVSRTFRLSSVNVLSGFSYSPACVANIAAETGNDYNAAGSDDRACPDSIRILGLYYIRSCLALTSGQTSQKSCRVLSTVQIVGM